MKANETSIIYERCQYLKTFLCALGDLVNAYFNDMHISDGLPIIPPTKRRYEAMLEYCPFDEDMVLCAPSGPSGRTVTVKDVAIAAVMALFVLSTVFYYNLMQVNKVFVLLAGFAACVVLLTLCVSFYFFPMLAMVDLPLGALLKNSMALVFGNIGKTLLALLLFALLIGLGVGLLPYSFIFAALIMFSFVASITTYLTYPAIEVRVMRREEGHAAGELYQTLPQQEQPEVQLRSAGLDELRFEDDETEENAEN